MNTFIKNNWFVILVLILFCCAIGYFALNDEHEEFKGKKVGEQDVVFEYNGKAVTADDLYDELFNDYSLDLTYSFVETALFRHAFEPDQQLLQEATGYYENHLSYLKYYYGENYESQILPALKPMGYTTIEGLKEYYIMMLMKDRVNKDYIDSRIDDLFPQFNEEKQPRIVRHILVKMTDANNPTVEEKAKMDEVDAALAQGDDFATVAKNFSDDTGSATNGGLFGYADKDSSLDLGFAAAAFELADGETSGWVKSQYGYHLIRIDSTKLEDLQNEVSFYNAMIAYYNLNDDILKQEYEKHTIDFHGNTDLEQALEKLISGNDTEVTK